MVHFTMECPALEGKRDYKIIDNSISDTRQRMITLLFKQRKHQEVGKMIKNLWNRRKAILRYKNEEQERLNSMNDTICSSRSDPGPVGNSHTPIRRGSRGLSTTRGLQ